MHRPCIGGSLSSGLVYACLWGGSRQVGCNTYRGRTSWEFSVFGPAAICITTVALTELYPWKHFRTWEAPRDGASRTCVSQIRGRSPGFQFRIAWTCRYCGYHARVRREGLGIICLTACERDKHKDVALRSSCMSTEFHTTVLIFIVVIPFHTYVSVCIHTHIHTCTHTNTSI